MYFLHLSVSEEFNKKIMNPELSEDDMKGLHRDAMTLFNLHFRADAEHKVPVSQHLVDEIEKSNNLKIKFLIGHLKRVFLFSSFGWCHVKRCSIAIHTSIVQSL